MNALIPNKLQYGDTVMVIAPSRSIGMLNQQTRSIAEQRFARLGLTIKFGQHIDEADIFGSAPLQSRIDDLHDAFSDPEVKGIFSVIGGFNSNQLLRAIDWELIGQNPKVLCGYSDITALQNAILAKTRMVTYSGPHFSSFGERDYFEYTYTNIRKCLFSNAPFAIQSSNVWTDDPWYQDQDNRFPVTNRGFYTLHEGEAEGTLIGGNLCTLNLLQGTEFFPSLDSSILFLEDDYMSDGPTFDRDLQSLIHQPGFAGVRGLVIGRFQNASRIDNHQLLHIIETKAELANMPVIVNADFGHTTPRFTFPIGGHVSISAMHGYEEITITQH